MVTWREVAEALFPDGFEIVEQDDFLCGVAEVAPLGLTVIGTTNQAELGVELALRMARAVLDMIRNRPRQPLLFLIDTAGQRLRRRDELLCIPRYLAHLAKSVEVARSLGHKTLSLVYGQALSGGFLANAMMTDSCAALPEAEIRVMSLPAMARVMRLPEARLHELAQSSPVFAPGVINYWRMGAVDELWQDDLPGCLARALQNDESEDRRAQLAAERGGRLLAHQVAQRVANDPS